MKYFEFIDEMAKRVKMCFDKEVSVEVHKVVKNNSMEYDSLIINEPGRNVTPNFYLQGMYSRYVDGIGLDSLVSEIVQKYESAYDSEKYENLSLDYADCQEKIVMRLISFEKNKKMLEETPYIPFLDMAVVFYFLADNDQNGIASIRITNEIMNDWKTDVKELYTLASDNSKRIFEEKQGYEYLNAIFFERHKRIFSKPRKIKTVISFILMAAGIVAIFIFKAGSTAKEFNAFADDLWKAMDKIITILVFIMYCITSGRNITKALFYNCDHSLLKYGYYRKPEAILKNFRIRLRFMLKNELPMVLVLCVGFVIDTFPLGKIDQWAKLLSIIGCIVLLSIFYSVMYLCMYYIFQPYTEGGKETGVGYSICKGVIYIASYSCLQIDTIPQYFVSIVLVVTVAGLIAGYALAYLMAPKHFVLK